MTESNEKVYIAKDGKKFFDKDECEIYECKLDKIKYFIVSHQPDLNETGMLMKESVVAVYSEYGDHVAIVEKWCIDEKHYPILGCSVQGCGFQRHFNVVCSKDGTDWVKKRWDEYKKGARTNGSVWPLYDEKVFLSPVPMEGFPEPFDYVTKWFSEI